MNAGSTPSVGIGGSAVHRILDLARGPLRLSVRFRLPVANDLADRFLDAANDLLERSLDPILVHDAASSCEEMQIACADMQIAATADLDFAVTRWRRKIVVPAE